MANIIWDQSTFGCLLVNNKKVKFEKGRSRSLIQLFHGMFAIGAFLSPQLCQGKHNIFLLTLNSK